LSISALLICAAWCLYGCQGTMNHTLIIPEVVHAERSGNDLSIGETRLFLHRHDGLRFDSASRTLYLDSSISLKILYYAGTSINDSVELFHGTLESVADTDHRRMYYIHDFQMDSCPARIYYLKSIVPGKEEMALFLEDNAFSAGELALFPAGQPAIRDSLLKVMLSLYVDEGEGEVENMEPFTMDLSHSEFRYCNRIGQAFFYTVGGKSNPRFMADQDQFFVAKMLPKPGIALRERATAILDMYTKADLRIPKYTIQRIFIRSQEAYELEGNFRLGNRSGKLYVVAMGDAASPVVLSAILYDNIDRRLSEVIYIAHSLQLKNTITH